MREPSPLIRAESDGNRCGLMGFHKYGLYDNTAFVKLQPARVLPGFAARYPTYGVWE